MIPTINTKFSVSFNRNDNTFTGLIISIDNNPENSDRKYRIMQTNRISSERGYPYSLPDSFIEVETNWFDTELTGRKITLL